MENFIKRITKDVDLSFAILLSFCVYVFFALNIEVFFSHNISFAILERFAVLGLVGLCGMCSLGDSWHLCKCTSCFEGPSPPLCF